MLVIFPGIGESIWPQGPSLGTLARDVAWLPPVNIIRSSSQGSNQRCTPSSCRIQGLKRPHCFSHRLHDNLRLTDERAVAGFERLYIPRNPTVCDESLLANKWYRIVKRRLQVDASIVVD